MVPADKPSPSITGLAVMSFSVPNKSCKKGANMASETSENRMDKRLNTTYRAIFLFWVRR
jgi:hypothetical protein